MGGKKKFWGSFLVLFATISMTTEPLRLEKTSEVTKCKHPLSTVFTTKLLGFWVLRPFQACEKHKAANQDLCQSKAQMRLGLTQQRSLPSCIQQGHRAGDSRGEGRAQEAAGADLPAGSAEPCRFCWLLKQLISAFQAGQLWKGMDERVKLTPLLWGSTGGCSGRSSAHLEPSSRRRPQGKIPLVVPPS